MEFKEIIGDLEPVYLNSFQLISKNISMFHIFNVLAPLAHSSSIDVLKSLEATNFDENLLE